MRLMPIPLLAPAEPCRDVLETLHALGRCRTLLRLLSAAGFDEDLAGQGPPFTIFAPTDAAFARLSVGVRALLEPAREEMLIDLLEYHLVRGRFDLCAAAEAGGVRTVHGAELHVAAEAGAFWADSARIRGPGFACENGIVHLVDGVLAPALSEARAWITARASFGAQPRARPARSRARERRPLLQDALALSRLQTSASVEDEPEASPASAVRLHPSAPADVPLATPRSRER